MVSIATSYSDMDPSPRVVLDIDDTELDGDVDTVTVWQLSKWGEVKVNRSPRSVAGGLVLTDYEVPAGVPVTYRVQQFAADGIELGYALSLAAEVTIPFGRAVIQDPLAPGNAIMVDGKPSFASVRSRSRPTRVYQAGGQTLAMSGLYSALQGMSLHCVTDTVEDRETLAAILEQSMILVRTHPDLRLPGSVYAVVAEVPADGTDEVQFGRDTEHWYLTGNEVSRPTIDVLIAVYSYDRFKAYLDDKYPPYGTYDDAAAEWSTYIDALRNPPTEV